MLTFNHRRLTGTTAIGLALLFGPTAMGDEAFSLIAPGAVLTKVRSGFQFTEGPAADAHGNVYFSDVRANRIYKWSPDGNIVLWREHTGGANGLYFAADGNLVACEGAKGRVVSFSPSGNLTVIADTYAQRSFNQPNDLWVDPKGGIYFSDPYYGRGELRQDGQHVYYIPPDRKHVLRVIADLKRPNGLIGTADGSLLYVADHGAGKTYRYRLSAEGALSDRILFVDSGSDGMTLDERGNVYLTADGVLIFSPKGELLHRIPVPEQPTNVTFGGTDGKTLFVTARGSVYTLRMTVRGMGASSSPPR